MTDVISRPASIDYTAPPAASDAVLSERRQAQAALEQAARTAEGHINYFVDNLLGKDSNGEQITYGRKTIASADGKFDVIRKYERQFWTNTTIMKFTPNGAEQATIDLIMADGRGGVPADFELFAPNRDNPENTDHLRFNTLVTGQEIEDLHRCEQFAATVMEAAEAGYLVQ